MFSRKIDEQLLKLSNNNFLGNVSRIFCTTGELNFSAFN